MIQASRIKELNQKPFNKKRGSFVLYWMQASQRVQYNHALAFAIMHANHFKVPVVVYFELIDDFPEANARHYHFMLEGLAEVRDALKKKGIVFVLYHKNAKKGISLDQLSKRAVLVVTDRGYTRMQRAWRSSYAEQVPVRMAQVETDVVIPVERAFDHEAYSAAILRPHIQSLLKQYVKPLRHTAPIKKIAHLPKYAQAFTSVAQIMKTLRVDRSVEPSPLYKGGYSEAKKYLKDFIAHKVSGYDSRRNDPSEDYVSNMSPYLHFGQISPVEIALEIQKKHSRSSKSYLEELIVRRELSMNFVFYNKAYDSIRCLPDWATKTLKQHSRDTRQYTYSRKQLENAETHDPYWNAAQKEMVVTGKMHGYMRMYWGKKILEWSKTPSYAYKTALYLNNKYELDGRDPNGFAGVAWCFGKHDRAWAERSIFGKVRYMNAAGLERKVPIKKYVEQVDHLLEQYGHTN